MGIPAEISEYVSRTVQDQLQAPLDRFEKRSREHLAEELSKLRLEFRQTLHEEIFALRHEMGVMKVELRQQFTTALMAQKADIMKWMFSFWVGEAAVTVGLILAIP